MASFTREAEALEAWVAAEVACYRVANQRGAAVRTYRLQVRHLAELGAS